MSIFGRHKLKDSEIKQIITKLRVQYSQEAQTYGENLFNVEALNERYFNALKSNIEIEIFLAAEIEALKQLKESLKKRQEEEKQKRYLEETKYERSFEKQADEMIAAYNKRISKYIRKPLAEYAEEEIERLYGGMYELYGCIILLRKALSFCPPEIKNIEREFALLIEENASRPPAIFEEYVDSYKREDSEKAINRAYTNTLKKAGVFINTIISTLKKIDTFDGVDIKNIVSSPFEEMFPRVAFSLKNKSAKEISSSVLAYALRLVKDFRLVNFKRV